MGSGENKVLGGKKEMNAEAGKERTRYMAARKDQASSISKSRAEFVMWILLEFNSCGGRRQKPALAS